MGTKWRNHQLRGIYLKRNVFWLKVWLRPEERHEFNGQEVKWYNLKTLDQAEAIRRADAIKEMWRKKRRDHDWPDHIPRKPWEPPDGMTLEEWALSLRGDKVLGYDDMHGEFEEDAVDVVVHDGRELEQHYGYERTKKFFEVARDNITPVSDLLERYQRETQVSDRSMAGKAWAFKVAGVEFLEDAATRRKAGDIVEKIAKNYSQHSVKTIVKDVRAVYSFAVGRGLIEANPWTNLKVAGGKTEKREITQEELQNIMADTRFERTKDTAEIIFLLCHTGLRLGEFLALRQNDVEYSGDGLFLHVRKSKTDAGVRKVPVPRTCHNIIERLRGNEGKLYPSSQSTLQAHGRKALDLCLGDEGKFVDMHSCRRACATALMHSYVLEAIAARILGHEHERMSYGLYAGPALDKQLLEAAEKVAEYFG